MNLPIIFRFFLVIFRFRQKKQANGLLDDVNPDQGTRIRVYTKPRMKSALESFSTSRGKQTGV